MAHWKLILNQICMNIWIGWDFASIDWVKWNSIGRTRIELESRFQKPWVFYSLNLGLSCNLTWLQTYSRHTEIPNLITHCHCLPTWFYRPNIDKVEYFYRKCLKEKPQVPIWKSTKKKLLTESSWSKRPVYFYHRAQQQTFWTSSIWFPLRTRPPHETETSGS